MFIRGLNKQCVCYVSRFFNVHYHLARENTKKVLKNNSISSVMVLRSSV